MVICLAAVVAFCTGYVLIRPAVTQEVRCSIEEHTHIDSCYTQLQNVEQTAPACTLASLGVHRHTQDCYGADGSLLCGYVDFVMHHHDEACYDENGDLWCTLPEVFAHRHDASCYASVPRESMEPEPGEDDAEEAFGDSDAQPDESSDEDADADMDAEEDTGEEPGEDAADTYQSDFRKKMIEAFADEPDDTSAEKAQVILVCEQPEVTLHRHTDACFDADGDWVCGRLELGRHQHTASCFAESIIPAEPEALTCTNTDESHVHGPRCYGTWVLTCGLEEHTHTQACFSAASNEAVDNSDGVLPLDAEGTLRISLLYGDEQPQETYPDGVFCSTHGKMTGYIKLEPSGLDTDLEDVTVTLSIPKEYVEESTISIPPFQTSSSATQYEILPVTEEADNYCVQIHFTSYDKSQILQLPFLLSFRANVVPDNYKLLVTASVVCGDASSQTEPNIYKPKYKPWGIRKFVNSNRLEAFGRDGAEVVVTPKEEDGNPYLDDLTYVDFAFIVNDYASANNQLIDFRDADEVTLTDTLPEYKAVDGSICIAGFEEEENPGWTLGADGTTVSKTYYGENSADVLMQIYNDKLRLHFPGLRFETQNENLVAELENSVSLTAVPSNAADGETHPSAEDSLQFKLTNDPATGGEFTKYARKGNIYDVDVYKTNPYPWSITLSNSKAQPLRHIRIQDRKIAAENGEAAVAGLDEALKFVRLESDAYNSRLPDGAAIADMVEAVDAYYTDGTIERTIISKIKENGSFTVTFDEDKICDGYEIIFRDDYEMSYGERVSFIAYTVYRDPDTHVPQGEESVTYTNAARAVNSYQRGTQTVYVYLLAAHSYDMLPSTENLYVRKLTLYNNANANPRSQSGDHVGDYFMYQVTLTGSLLYPEEKEYRDLRIVDLLPDGITYDSIYLLQCTYPFLDGGRNYQPEILENYHNSGRTALIFHLNAENVQKNLDKDKFLTLYFWVRIDESAHAGTVENEVYVVGDNLDEYQGATGGASDRYDLNNNGRTDDQVAFASSPATIIAAQSLYAEKFLAPAGTGNWNKHGLAMKAGTEFDYLLKITNETAEVQRGLIVYDTLPACNDTDIFGTARNSEFEVHLREAITPPEGYDVFYTTSQDVYAMTMQDAVRADIWSQTVSDPEAVTAFKLVAEEDTILDGKSVFQAEIPVRAERSFDEQTLKQLEQKSAQDQDSGTQTYLEAVNSFGFRTDSVTEKDSNAVWARVPFAGFCVKKIDGVSESALPGAEFTLTDAAGETATVIQSDEAGLLQFRNLAEGAYTLTETKTPDGYQDRHTQIKVTITQNPVTMAYTVTFEGETAGSGSEENPFCVKNYTTYALPQTGGAGVLPMYGLGAALVLFGGIRLLRKKKGGAKR